MPVHPELRSLTRLQGDRFASFGTTLAQTSREGGAGIWHWDWEPEALAYSSTHRCRLPYVLDHREDCVMVVWFSRQFDLEGFSRCLRLARSLGEGSERPAYLCVYLPLLSDVF